MWQTLLIIYAASMLLFAVVGLFATLVRDWGEIRSFVKGGQYPRPHRRMAAKVAGATRHAERRKAELHLVA